eukprot:1176339-Prorocentrum_minimum.AAC.1
MQSPPLRGGTKSKSCTVGCAPDLRSRVRAESTRDRRNPFAGQFPILTVESPFFPGRGASPR